MIYRIDYTHGGGHFIAIVTNCPTGFDADRIFKVALGRGYKRGRCQRIDANDVAKLNSEFTFDWKNYC